MEWSSDLVGFIAVIAAVVIIVAVAMYYTNKN